MKPKQLENVLITEYCNVTSENENLIHPSIESPSVICSHLHTNTSDFDSLFFCHKQSIEH